MINLIKLQIQHYLVRYTEILSTLLIILLLLFIFSDWSWVISKNETQALLSYLYARIIAIASVITGILLIHRKIETEKHSGFSSIQYLSNTNRSTIAISNLIARFIILLTISILIIYLIQLNYPLKNNIFIISIIFTLNTLAISCLMNIFDKIIHSEDKNEFCLTIIILLPIIIPIIVTSISIFEILLSGEGAFYSTLLTNLSLISLSYLLYIGSYNLILAE